MIAAQKTSTVRVQTRRAGVARAAVVARKPVVAVRASAKPEQHSRAAVMQAALVASSAAILANPLVAEAAITPSLKNFALSLAAGATVLAVIAGGITFVSNFDPVNRG